MGVYLFPWAHPRVCGEDADRHRRRPGWRGSPPRMRGRHLVGGVRRDAVGLTPAYAGKTSPVGAATGMSGAHPRVCGEDLIASGIAAISPGSPPRMRGRPLRVSGPLGRDGLTPAYAGKTRRSPTATMSWTAHPRVCGEDAAAMTELVKGGGSPPRMRGRRRLHGRKTAAPRLTPAYAGKTTSDGDAVTSIRAHPRVCGEDHV